MMKYIWNLAENWNKNCKKVNSKKYKIRLFLFLNSAAWGVLAVIIAGLLKAAGCFDSLQTGTLLLAFAGYGVFLVGLIGGEVYALKADGVDRAYLEEKYRE